MNIALYIYYRNYLTYEERPRSYVDCFLDQNLQSCEMYLRINGRYRIAKFRDCRWRFSVLSTRRKKKSLSYRLSRKNNEKFILSGRIFGKEGKLWRVRVPFRSKFPSYIRVACLPKKIIAIKEGITSRQSIRSDSGFTRVKAIFEWYIYIYICVCMCISQERRRRGRKIKKVKNRGKRTEIPIEETFNFRETKKKKRRENLSKDLDERRARRRRRRRPSVSRV